MSHPNDSLDLWGMRHDLPPHATGPARLLRAMLRNGLDREAVPHAMRLAVELEELAAERQEQQEVAA
jgi:hypothetical protein